MKQFIKKIPIIGWLFKFLYNIIRINNLKHIVFMNMQQLHLQEQKLQAYDRLEEELHNIKSDIESIIAKEILHCNISIQERLDQFIFDSKMIISNDKISLEQKLISIEEKVISIK